MKPTTIEDHHIWEQEQNLLRRKQQDAAELQKLRRKDLHWMHCPKCGQNLVTEHHGVVEIDLCPNCRGLWLDANELETILARESGFFQSCVRSLRGR